MMMNMALRLTSRIGGPRSALVMITTWQTSVDAASNYYSNDEGDDDQAEYHCYCHRYTLSTVDTTDTTATTANTRMRRTIRRNMPAHVYVGCLHGKCTLENRTSG